MECHRRSGSHVVNMAEFQSGNTGNNVNENCGLGSVGKIDCGTSDDIVNKQASANTDLTSSCNKRPFQFEVGNVPPNKRATFDHKKATRKVLYKTRPCFQFRAGTCPFVENCDFAHCVEELRELPHNWQEIIATHKTEMLGLNEEMHGLNQKKPFMDFSSGVSCQFDQSCNYVHNEHYMERTSAAICLLPGPGGGCETNESKLTWNASNWKTRICNKWESTGSCRYGNNCIFAHGFAGSSAVGANEVAVPAKPSVGAVGAPATSLVPYSYRIGAPLRRPNGKVTIRRWKGPDKISKIYGDWIDDL